jgi:hypothetical protein
MEQKDLIILYLLVNKYPGWLSGVKKSFGLSDQDVEFLEHLDDEAIKICPMTKNQQIHIKKMEQEYRWGILGAESDDEIIDILSRNISQFNRDYEESFMNDHPYLTRALMRQIWEVDEMERVRTRLRFNQVRKISTNRTSSRISDQQIARAREYPLESLVGNVNKHGFTNCPFHDDKKPSMLIKNNFGWCFSCQSWVDPIKWCMTFKGMSFPESINFLSGREMTIM